MFHCICLICLNSLTCWALHSLSGANKCHIDCGFIISQTQKLPLMISVGGGCFKHDLRYVLFCWETRQALCTNMFHMNWQSSCISSICFWRESFHVVGFMISWLQNKWNEWNAISHVDYFEVCGYKDCNLDTLQKNHSIHFDFVVSLDVEVEEHTTGWWKYVCSNNFAIFVSLKGVVLASLRHGLRVDFCNPLMLLRQCGWSHYSLWRLSLWGRASCPVDGGPKCSRHHESPAFFVYSKWFIKWLVCFICLWSWLNFEVWPRRMLFMLDRNVSATSRISRSLKSSFLHHFFLGETTLPTKNVSIGRLTLPDR